MGHHRILPACQPLIRSLSERLVRMPLGTWERTLAELLRTALTRSPIDWDALPSIFNQLAVIQAYRGHNDRALGFCGCLARELPTWGVDQDGVDLLAQYYANQASENDLDQQQPDLLDRNDSATEACVGTMPAR